MTTAARATFFLPTADNHVAPGPAFLNGDWDLSPQQVGLYMNYHAVRNRRNAVLSRRQGVCTFAAPPLAGRLPTDVSPPRAALNSFFRFAAAALFPAFQGRDVTIVDIGCGGAPCLEFFEAAGYRGLYIGIDIKRKASWTDEPTAAFRKQLVLGNVLTLDVGALPPVDLLISSTALEHIQNDAAAIARLSTRLRADGAQVHYVPGEGALPLYGPHGWRQYSPRCLRALFPTGRIFRAGGPCSSLVHRVGITQPSRKNRKTLMVGSPKRYAVARNVALRLDCLLGNRPATMYGVISGPGV